MLFSKIYSIAQFLFYVLYITFLVINGSNKLDYLVCVMTLIYVSRYTRTIILKDWMDKEI